MLNKTVVLLVLLGLVFLFCVVMLMLDNKKHNNTKLTVENFSPDEELAKIQDQLDGLDEEQLKGVISQMKDKLVGYGLLPEQQADVDLSQWVPKTNIPPPGPRVDLSQYMKKSSCPPEKVCPPQKEIDYTQYVKRSTLPPQQQCPPCVAPKVKVSAGLCKECPDCPAPPPCQTCPQMSCPEPKPCPKVECPKCTEIKYIKVPTVITRTIRLDAANNVVSEEVVSEEDANGSNNTSEEEASNNTANNLAANEYTIPTATRAANKAANEKCNVVGLNSEFRKFGIYGLE